MRWPQSGSVPGDYCLPVSAEYFASASEHLISKSWPSFASLTMDSFELDERSPDRFHRPRLHALHLSRPAIRADFQRSVRIERWNDFRDAYGVVGKNFENGTIGENSEAQLPRAFGETQRSFGVHHFQFSAVESYRDARIFVRALDSKHDVGCRLQINLRQDFQRVRVRQRKRFTAVL